MTHPAQRPARLASLALFASFTWCALSTPAGPARAQSAPPAAEIQAPAPAQAEAACTEVEVLNVRPARGHLLLVAFDSEAGFNRQPVARLRVPAGEAVTRFRWCGLAAETLAVTLFQDLDGDGRMARNLVGIPTEPWGSSGTPGMMGPRWDLAQVRRVSPDGKPLVLTLVQ